MLNLKIKTIPHNKQRYDTVGDYYIEDQTGKKRGRWTQFNISKLGDWRYELLVALHEMVEWSLITQRGIKIEDIDKFDIEFEERRKRGEVSAEAEPGNDPAAPYYFAHQVATVMEKNLAMELGVNWIDYTVAVNSVC